MLLLANSHATSRENFQKGFFKEKYLTIQKQHIIIKQSLPLPIQY